MDRGKGAGIGWEHQACSKDNHDSMNNLIANEWPGSQKICYSVIIIIIAWLLVRT